MDRGQAFAVFRAAVREMWRNADFVLPRLAVSLEEPAGGVLASLSYTGTPYAIGRSVLRSAPRYLLRISDRLLAMDDDAVRKIMIHEAAHIGHGKHTAEFRSLVRAFGGSVSEMALEGDLIRCKRKMGRRYETVRAFPGSEEREALRWCREQAKANPGIGFILTA